MSDETDYSSLPLEDRLGHKVWKVRLEAYEEIAKQFEGSRNDKDECFQRFNNQPGEWKRIVTDANVVAQEAGISALLKFLELGGTTNNVSKLRSAGVVTALCEKGLSSSRAGTKDKTINCILLFVEISNEIDGVIEDILAIVGARLPKLVAGCVTALHTIVANFGCQVVPVKLIIPNLLKLFGHADRNVRAETTKLSVELYKWMREALVTILLPELKPVQQKDLTKAFEAVQGEQPSQLRYTRKQQAEIARREEEARAAAAAAAAAAKLEGDSGDVEMVDVEDGVLVSHLAPEFNPFDMMDPVEVLSKLPSDLHSRISSAKWKDRKEVLDEVHAILEKSVKLQSSDDYSDLVRIFSKCMKDANVQVVQLAANCVEFLAKGLQTGFARYQHFVLAPMLERTKEKKASVAEALANSLDSIFASSSLSDILEETINGMKHKTPQVKIATTNYLQRCLAQTKTAPKSSEIDLIMETGVKLLSDSQEPVRQASTEMIGTLMKITGPRELNSFLEKVDDNRKGKVVAFSESVTVKAKMGSGAPPRAASGVSSNTNAPPRRPAGGPSTSAQASTAGGLGPFGARQPMRSNIGATPSLGGVNNKKLSLPAVANTLKKPKPVGGSTLLPAKRGATSPAKRTEVDPSRGTLGRSLLSRPTPANSIPNAFVDSGISTAEREELEELRHKSQQWKQTEERLLQTQRLKDEEYQKALNEISTLQKINDNMTREHNTATLTVKQRDTHILRLTSDLESAKLKIRDLEQTIEMLKLQLQLHQLNAQQLYRLPSHSTFSNPEIEHGRESTSPFLNRQSFQGIGSGEIGSRITSGELSSRVNRLSIDPEHHNSSENINLGITTTRFNTSPYKTTEHSNNYTSHLNKETMDINSNDESWKRAAEVTNQLKARIEKMKARSRSNFS